MATQASATLRKATSDLGPMRGVCAPSLDDPHFESLLLRLHAAVDVAGFWDALQSALDTVAPSDANVVYLDFADFSRTWSAAHILTTPRAARPREWWQRRREVDLMPAFVLDHPGVPLYRLSDVMPNARRLRGSEFFRRFMAAEGWHYTACVLFWREDGLRSEIAIRRTAEQGDFTPREMALLQRLHPHIDTALQRLAALEARRAPAAANDAAAGGRCVARYGTAAPEPVHPLSCRLTPAERALVRLVREGCSNKEIAHRLDKSVRTVKTQLTSVYRKFGVRSRSRLLAALH